jgi:hypothetical protein
MAGKARKIKGFLSLPEKMAMSESYMNQAVSA